MHRQKEEKKVLLAIRPEDVPLARSLVGDGYQTAFCHTLEQAQACLDQTIESVVCGVHFDHGTVFDYLRYIRARQDTRDIPVFIVLGTSSRYSPSIVHGMRRAAEILGVTAFTDLTRLMDKFGQKQAIEILRQGLRDARNAASSPANV